MKSVGKHYLQRPVNVTSFVLCLMPCKPKQVLPPALQESIIGESPCTKEELAEICTAWVDIEEDEAIINDDVEEAMEDLMSSSMLPSFDIPDTDMMIDDEVPVQVDKSYTWNECLASCDIIRQFLVENDLSSELLAFDGFQHKLRLNRMSKATSQLSIKSFFNCK